MLVGGGLGKSGFYYQVKCTILDLGGVKLGVYSKLLLVVEFEFGMRRFILF